MARYAVAATVTISVHVEVDAENEIEARAKANECPMQRLCGHCSVGEDGAWSTSGELDGEPSIEAVREIKTTKRGRR